MYMLLVEAIRRNRHGRSLYVQIISHSWDFPLELAWDLEEVDISPKGQMDTRDLDFHHSLH
jgi:hypothetical protein